MEREPFTPEKANPKVVLHFMRHSIREEAAPGTEDRESKLKPEGRTLAAGKFEEPIDLRYSHAAGSPRVRAQETAAIATTGNPETKPEDLGKGKMRIHEALDFDVSRETEYGKHVYAEYAKGPLFNFFVNESDRVAREIGDDPTSSTYSRMAANIAGIIHRNYEAALRGVKILEQSENPENKTNDFERVLGTHATIQECFLLKMVEKLHGPNAREELLSRIGSKGFDYMEGFDVMLSKEGNEEKIRVIYKKGDYSLDEIVPINVIEEIIEEGR